MMEKRNTSDGQKSEKAAAGDAGALDDIVDMAAGKMARSGGARGRERRILKEALDGVVPPVDMQQTGIC